MSITPLNVASMRPSKPSKPRKPFRAETPARGRFELADVRRREVLQRNLDDAMRRRALHLRTDNMAAYRKADEQADHYLNLIVAGRAAGRWES